MASTEVVKMSVTNNSPSQLFSHSHDHFQSKNNGNAGTNNIDLVIQVKAFWKFPVIGDI